MARLAVSVIQRVSRLRCAAKDRHPFPVPLKTYSESLATLRRALDAAKLGTGKSGTDSSAWINLFAKWRRNMSPSLTLTRPPRRARYFAECWRLLRWQPAAAFLIFFQLIHGCMEEESSASEHSVAHNPNRHCQSRHIQRTISDATHLSS